MVARRRSGGGGYEAKWSGQFCSRVSQPYLLDGCGPAEPKDVVSSGHPPGAPVEQGNGAKARSDLDRGIAYRCAVAEVLLRTLDWDSILRFALCASQVQEVL